MQFKLPELGEGVHEGELVRWKVQIGQWVKFDQPLCEIMTDKASVEIPSALEGKVAVLHAKEGEMVQVGQLMMQLEGAEKAEEPHKASVSIVPVVAHAPAIASPSFKTAAAPSTRRLAQQMGVELSSLRATGPHGRVMKEDVLLRSSSDLESLPKKVLANVLEKSHEDERIAFRGLRKKISEKMRLSKDKAAHFTYFEEADATALVELRNLAKQAGEKQGIKVTYLPFIMKAMVAALKVYPILNATLDEERGEIVLKKQFNIGVSVQTPEGLMAPVIKSVDSLSLMQLASQLQVLIEKARTKRLSQDDLKGGTMTLTNVGSIGGLFSTPIINYPEVAILGLNKIAKRVVVKTIQGKDEMVIRDWTVFSLSLDHRIVDGAIGAEFMKLFIQFIENPSTLLFE